jgi:hypothetical protein
MADVIECFKPGFRVLDATGAVVSGRAPASASRVQTPAGGRIAPPFISDRTILDQSDADRGLNLNVPAYFPKLLP